MNANKSNSPPPTELIGSFLSAFDIGAVAHARIELQDDEKSELQAFANGELDATRRKALIPLLAHNTIALEYIAKLMKKKDASREGQED